MLDLLIEKEQFPIYISTRELQISVKKMINETTENYYITIVINGADYHSMAFIKSDIPLIIDDLLVRGIR